MQLLQIGTFFEILEHNTLENPSHQNPNDGWVHMERVFIVKVLASLEFSSTSLAKWGFITSMAVKSIGGFIRVNGTITTSFVMLFFCYAGFWVRFTFHSSEIRGLHSTKCSSETLQNLLYFMYKKTHVVFFFFHFV